LEKRKDKLKACPFDSRRVSGDVVKCSVYDGFGRVTLTVAAKEEAPLRGVLPNHPP